MSIAVTGFDWDEGNAGKCRVHGVSVGEIEAMFTSATLIVFADPTEAEPRLRAIGKTAAGRSVFVVYTLRESDGKKLIRPISARYMHAKEVRFYERQTKSQATSQFQDR